MNLFKKSANPGNNELTQNTQDIDHQNALQKKKKNQN